MKEYKFWGWQTADVKPLGKTYPFEDPRQMYDYLTRCWGADTCAPRLRDKWSPDNMTEGQCSITAFLVQDIFGGEVYGIRLPDGAYHCYNVVGEVQFDLTSEQFGDEVLDYTQGVLQSREEHFADQDKFARYLLLTKKLLEVCAESKQESAENSTPLATATTSYNRDMYRGLHRKNTVWAGVGLGLGLAFLGAGIALVLTRHSMIYYVLTAMGAFLTIFGGMLLGMIVRNTRKGVAAQVTAQADFYPDYLVVRTFVHGEENAHSKVYYRDLAFYRTDDDYAYIYVNPQQAFPLKLGQDTGKILEILDRNQVKAKY